MKNPTVSFSLRINQELYDKLKYISKKEMRSVNSQYEYFLLQCVEQYEKEKGTIVAQDE